MKRRFLRALVTGLMVLGGWQPGAGAAILINEVLADPPALTGDSNGDGTSSVTQDEFVELVNTGEDPVLLDLWTLSDALKVRHVFASGTSIPARGLFVVFGGGSPQGFSHATIASSGTLSLNNAGDTITLADVNALLIDSLIYGAEGGEDVSLTRSPDASGAFIGHATVSSLPFSPGTTIEGLFGLPPPPETIQPDLPDVSEPDESDPFEPSLPASENAPVVPEPSPLMLLGSGLLYGLGRLRRRVGGVLR